MRDLREELKILKDLRLFKTNKQIEVFNDFVLTHKDFFEDFFYLFPKDFSVKRLITIVLKVKEFYEAKDNKK